MHSKTLEPPQPSVLGWGQALAEPAQEFGPVNLAVLAGQVPPGLRGSFYRNGPGRLQRGGETVPHWFDGDGAILAVHFDAGSAQGIFRYVQTQGYQAEEQAGRYLYSGYGQLAPAPFWQRWGQSPKNAANTSVLALPDRLLALWEGGLPHGLDLKTLSTQGLDDLKGLTPGRSYSAHPKIDPDTGDIYNFGVCYGRKLSLDLYRSDATGKICQQGSLPLSRFAVIHDFSLAGPYLLFLIPPLQADIFGLLLGFKSFSQAFQWRPQLGTQVLVVDRETFQLLHQFEVEPWFQWHIGNSYVEADGNIAIHLVRYADWQTNTWLSEVVTGQPHTLAPGYLWRMSLSPQSGQLLASEQVSPLAADFPVIPLTDTGKRSRDLYMNCHAQPNAPAAAMFDSIARVDLETGAISLGQPGADQYPMEPILAGDADHPAKTWVLTVVYDAVEQASTLQIYRAENLAAGPVCILGLPEVVPFGFHGTWRPA